MRGSEDKTKARTPGNDTKPQFFFQGVNEG